jgi:hypothetical protein
VSFDLYFVALGPGETFQDAMDRLEESAAEDAALAAADVAHWQSVLDRVRPLLPDARNSRASRIENLVMTRQESSCHWRRAS